MKGKKCLLKLERLVCAQDILPKTGHLGMDDHGKWTDGTLRFFKRKMNKKYLYFRGM